MQTVVQYEVSGIETYINFSITGLIDFTTRAVLPASACAMYPYLYYLLGQATDIRCVKRLVLVI